MSLGARYEKMNLENFAMSIRESRAALPSSLSLLLNSVIRVNTQCDDDTAGGGAIGRMSQLCESKCHDKRHDDIE